MTLREKKDHFGEELQYVTHALNDLSSRLDFLKCATKELERLFGTGERIQFKNDIIWRLFQDSFANQIVDTGSLLKRITRGGGLLKQFSANLNKVIRPNKAYPKDLRLSINFVGTAPSEKERTTIESSILDGRRQQYAETLAKIFPGSKTAKSGNISQNDVDCLIAEFHSKLSDLKTARDEFFAHRHETNLKGLRFGIIELESSLEELKTLTSNIRLITSLTSYSYGNAFHANMEQTACDLIDLAVFGSTKLIAHRWGINELMSLAGKHVYTYQLREAAYEKLKEDSRNRSPAPHNQDSE